MRPSDAEIGVDLFPSATMGVCRRFSSLVGCRLSGSPTVGPEPMPQRTRSRHLSWRSDSGQPG